MDDQSDIVAILLRRDNKSQLWLDFGMTLTDLPQGFKPSQMVNVTGTMETGNDLHCTPFTARFQSCSNMSFTPAYRGSIWVQDSIRLSLMIMECKSSSK